VGTPGAFYRIRRRRFGILACRKSLRDVRNKAPSTQIFGSVKVALGYDAANWQAKKKERKASLA
jgi:hypothetical protein